MEMYMKEALRNIHAEEAARITTTLLTDVTVKTQRKMMATRLKFLRFESEAAALEREGAEGADSELPASDDALSEDETANPSAQVTFTPSAALMAEKREALGEMADVFAQPVNCLTCPPATLTATLRTMMIADIVELRQVLEREAQELKDLRKLKAESTRVSAKARYSLRRRRTVHGGDGQGDDDLVGSGVEPTPGLVEQEVAAAEERAKMTLSEEIVEMLEAKYGTARHSGEPAPSLGVSGRFLILLRFQSF
jgi:hypothetical protein